MRVFCLAFQRFSNGVGWKRMKLPTRMTAMFLGARPSNFSSKS